MGEIVKSDEIFLEMDRRDQQQIVAAATGEVIGELMYKVKGKNAISWAGINHICFFMGDIEVDPWIEWDRIVMFGDRVYWSATVRARNTKYNLASLGTAECPELQKIYDLDEKKNRIPIPGKPGEFKSHLEPDEHCRRKSLSKAQRNAKRAVIPEALLKQWLTYFQDKKTGKKVDPPGQPKVVEAEYKMEDEKKDKKTEKKRTSKKTEKKAEKKTPEKPEKKEMQLSLGTVDVDTVAFNLKAAGISEDTVIALEQGDNVIVDPTRELTEEEIYKISGVLEDVGAVFEEKGYYEQQWKIKKKA